MPAKNGDKNPKWPPGDATLVRKASLIPEAADRLPVYTATFTMPQDMLDTALRTHRMDLGDYIWITRPGYGNTCYSMSEKRADEFDITFKVYAGGECTTFLKDVPPGTAMQVSGRISRVLRNPGKYVGVVAFGVGITEALPVVEAELEKGDANHVRLLWAVRTKAETFWHQRIAAIEKAHGERFSIVYILSREERDGCLHGRVNASVLADVFKSEYGGDARFLSVGTAEMMVVADDMFRKAGYPMPEHALFPGTTAAKALLHRTDIS